MLGYFTVYPAIDILDGKCVRLFQGDYAQGTVYNFDPLAVAKDWAKLGAKFLHIVDLDGAKMGSPVNLDTIREIAQSLDIPVQLGGGIRDYETAKQVLDAGVKRIIIGTAALRDLEFTKKLLAEHGDQVAVGMDCRDGKLAIEGWQTDTEMRAIDFANDLKKEGLELVIYTDISRDGTLEGPNIVELKEFADLTGVATISSGGISNIKDVLELKSLKDKGSNIDGAIIGKALYTGDIKLDELYGELSI